MQILILLIIMLLMYSSFQSEGNLFTLNVIPRLNVGNLSGLINAKENLNLFTVFINNSATIDYINGMMHTESELKEI